MRGSFFLGRTNQGTHKPLSWESVPEEVKEEFLKDCGSFHDWYIDGSVHTPTEYKKELIDEFIEEIKKGKQGYYQYTDTYLYTALEKFPIEGKEVAIVGSVQPWYESVVLAYGGFPTTIEYNQIETDDPRLTLMTVAEFNKKPKKFPFVFSISSFEHDGLGRYGDPIDPNGDLKAMKNVKENMLEKDGILFLAVPVGMDKLVFNAHRIYGNRLEKLSEGYEILGFVPMQTSERVKLDTINGDFQPILVLRNK